MVDKTNENGKVKANVSINTNGKEEKFTFEGTEAEVQAKLDSIK